MEKNAISSTSPSDATDMAIEKLNEAKNAVKAVIKVRAQNYLSFSRAANVAKEINDLIKVLSIYNHNQLITKL